MLNPFAHEFSPTAFIPETKLTTHQNNNNSKNDINNNSNRKNTRKPPPAPKGKKEATAVDPDNKKGATTTAKDKGKDAARKSQSKDTNHKSKDTKSKDNKAKDNKPKDNNKSRDNVSKDGNKPKEGNKDVTTATTSIKSKDINKGKEPARKKRDSFQSSATATTSTANSTRKKSVPTLLPSEFEQESPFIAIEAAINPVHKLDNNSIESRRKQSLGGNTKKQYEHGYERYIDWIDRSLQVYGIVTVVGMDKAIVDVISLVTILQDRKIGEHQDIETFTMNQGNKPTSCIQVKLHPFYLYK